MRTVGICPNQILKNNVASFKLCLVQTIVPKCVFYEIAVEDNKRNQAGPAEHMGTIGICPNQILQNNIKSDTFQYNTLGCWFDCLIDETSDGPSIILIEK